MVLSPSKFKTLVALSKVPVTLYLNSGFIIASTEVVPPPRPKSPLNNRILLAVLRFSSIPVMSKFPAKGIVLYFMISCVDVVLFSIFKVPCIEGGAELRYCRLHL